MKSDGSTSVWNNLSVFSKIYKVVFCSKQNQRRRVSKCDQASEEERGCPATDTSPEQAWFTAVKQHSTALVRQMLDERQVEVNLQDQGGWSALHVAAWNGFEDIADVLLLNGADINLSGPGGTTPVALAAQRGHCHVVSQLVTVHADIHKTANLDDNYDVTPLHLAAQNGHGEVVRALLEAGCVVNASMECGDMKGVTALHLAVQADHLDVMDVLLAAGSDVHSSTHVDVDSHC